MPNPQQTAADFHPEVLKLFDQYVHGGIDRRGFLKQSSGYAMAAGTTAAGLLAALSPNFARAQKVPPADARIRVESLEFDSPQGYGKGRAYVARPANASGPRPVVLVAHENRGLNPHIEDIARRLAVDGYIAVAPDATFPLGGYPGDEDKARDRFAQLDQAKTAQDFIAAAQVARKIQGGNGKLGVVGFCWGGGMVNKLAVSVPELNAGVAFYGPAPAIDQVAKIKARMLLVFAGNDERINATWPPYEAALKAANVRYDAVTYPGVEHGFNNDTTPRFDQASAAKAWERTLAVFKESL
jgi:carboxymethylenebutenolidase